MKDRDAPRIKGRWCPVHRTREPKLEVPCAYCHQQMHLHSGHVKLAKRGMAQGIVCGRCLRNNCLVVSWDGKRWELAVRDRGQPALQTHLGLKVLSGGPRHG